MLNRAFWFMGGSPKEDVDANTFFTAAGITDPTQKSAVTSMVIALKAAGLWTISKAIYPFVGNAAASTKYNLKDPRDLDAAYRIVWAGGVTHDSNGVTFNGTTGVGDTKFVPSTVYPSSRMSFHYYLKSYTAGIIVGASKQYAWPANAQILNGNGTGMIQIGTAGLAASNFLGMNSEVRTATNQYHVHDQSIYSIVSSFVGNSPEAIHFGNYTPTNGFWSDGCLGFAMIADDMTTAQAVVLDSIIYTFCQTLNRHVVRADTHHHFGDSITAGVGATPTTRWAYLLAQAKGRTESNYGANATTLQVNGTTSAFINFYNGTSGIPLKRVQDKALFIAYGYNDVYYQLLGTGPSVAGFQSNLETVIAFAKASRGWSTGNIYVVTGYYENAQSWTGIGSGVGLPTYNLLRTAAQTACTNQGATWIDPYTAAGDSDFIETSDPKIHPNPTGHQKYATYIGALVS